MHSLPSLSLTGLSFNNHFVNSLPADPTSENAVRQVEHAAYSRIDLVKTTPTIDPTLLSLSGECARDCLGLEGEWGGLDTPTLRALSGLELVKGMDAYAMCYGGHQFGSWAG